jgi:hypothetical protein
MEVAVGYIRSVAAPSEEEKAMKRISPFAAMAAE